MKFDFDQLWSKYGKNAIFALAIAITFIILFRPATDPDLGWHLKQGEIVLNEARFVRSDQFSHTLTGFSWAPYWLSEVIFYQVFENLGLIFLSILSAILAAATFFLTARFSIRHPNQYAVSFLAITAAVICIPFSGVRIQIISWVLFAVFYLLLSYKFYLKKQGLFLLPAIILLWANLHYGFVLAIFIFGLLVAYENGKYLAYKFLGQNNWFINDNLSFKQAVWLNLLFVITILASFATPYGFGSYKSVFGFSTSSVNVNNIAEWLPLSVKSDFGFVFFILLAFIIFQAGKNLKKFSPFEIICALILTLAGLASVRHLPFALIVLIPIGVRVWPEISIPKRFLPVLRMYLLLTMICVLVFYGYSQIKEVLTVSFDPAAYATKGDYPNLAVKYLKSNPIPGRMFNEYNWGGYLIWQLPNVATFIDGRMPGWKMQDRDILSDYLAIWKVTPKTDQLLEKYQVEYALLAIDSPIFSYLEKSDWQVVYKDQQAVVLIKGK